ncbi:hypothetical protein D3C76_1766060 [compost metagenome]
MSTRGQGQGGAFGYAPAAAVGEGCSGVLAELWGKTLQLLCGKKLQRQLQAIGQLMQARLADFQLDTGDALHCMQG